MIPQGYSFHHIAGILNTYTMVLVRRGSWSQLQSVSLQALPQIRVARGPCLPTPQGPAKPIPLWHGVAAPR